jgi:hypothetical protein
MRLKVRKRDGEAARNRVDLEKDLANNALPFWEEALLLKSLECGEAEDPKSPVLVE